MEPVIAAVHDTLKDNAAELRTVVQGLPPEALNWQPAPETSSLAVLVAHAVSATVRLVDSALTGTFDRPRYLADERIPAFATHATDAAGLAAMVDRLDALLARLAAAGSDAALAGPVTYIGDAPAPRTRAWNLIHAVEHLREHIGHAQLTRQVWEQRTGNRD